MAPRPLEFWFEFASTYSYIAAHRVEAVARAAGVTVIWRPFLLGPIFQQQGWGDSPFNLYALKGAYMWRDMERLCEKYAIAFRKPSKFPRRSLLALRVALAGEHAPWLPSFVRAVYRANFYDDADIADRGILRDLLIHAGCPAPDEALARAESTEIKQRLREHTEQALAHGIFGAPSFRADSELFWGQDRLEDAIGHCVRP